ncbi:serine/threonine-protein kinase ZRK1-like [Spinacia oleracea]|uniref:Serine/threonine-protein kinase ZRK1-like n=1 Tax=Spinacia oleracea TaxID=3562 RepID=A0ABM3RU72_SPIOL|nr:serine/threonine-protein kinase ZRK1-like [Spinacia oleracea]
MLYNKFICVAVQKKKKKMLYMKKLKCWPNQEKKKCENNFIRNGSLLQEELISFCKGKNLPIHVFSAKQVKKMSDFSLSQLLEEDAHFRIYRGTIEDDGNRTVSIKKYFSTITYVGIQEFPVIVYEFPDQGCLRNYVYRDEGTLLWKHRLKIASEISYALAYLQNGFHRPVIFRNLSSKDVFLDKDYVVKLTGFYFSVSIPEGEVHVNDAVVSTIGYGAPEYMASGRLTAKTDVYCFGLLLLELLAGCSRFKLLGMIRDHNQSIEISMVVDPAISTQVEENGKQQQLNDVIKLALRCSVSNEDDRPSMIDVATQLKKILHSI